jgi:hypothetical protein
MVHLNINDLWYFFLHENSTGIGVFRHALHLVCIAHCALETDSTIVQKYSHDRGHLHTYSSEGIFEIAIL